VVQHGESFNAVGFGAKRIFMLLEAEQNFPGQNHSHGPQRLIAQRSLTFRHLPI
jgi:hypothetical protein